MKEMDSDESDSDPEAEEEECDAPEIEPCTVIIHARYTAEIKDSRQDITAQLYK